MKYFTIAELTKSDTATRLKIDNTPSAEIVAKLTALVECVLDKVRELHGAPIRVTSALLADYQADTYWSAYNLVAY